MNRVGIYHPLSSNKNPPNLVFIDEIAKFMSEEFLQLENLIVIGDFNMQA
jgi:exonuclease III